MSGIVSESHGSLQSRQSVPQKSILCLPLQPCLCQCRPFSAELALAQAGCGMLLQMNWECARTWTSHACLPTCQPCFGGLPHR